MEYSYQNIMDEIFNRSTIQPVPSYEESFETPEPELEPKPKLKIETMTTCLYGRSCPHLQSEPPARPLCDKAGLPVWDLKECPGQKRGKR